jgi:acyl-CoA synthetase (AMP-forming)/AMP-acid ligase II
MKTIVDVVRERASKFRNERGYTFLKDGFEKQELLGYASPDLRARALAVRLLADAAPGSRVLILCPPGLDYLVSFFGSLYAGMVAVPVYPPTSPRDHARLVRIAEDAEASLVLTLGRDLAGLTAWMQNLRGAKAIAVDELQGDADLFRASSVAGLAMLQYTSGSTGQPKGVMVTHQNLMHNLEQVYRGFGHSEESCVVSWLPPYHDMGLIGTILQPVYCGGRAYLMSPLTFVKHPLRWLQAISRYGATTSGAPNFAYDLCVRRVKDRDLEGLDLSCWRVAGCGAEPVHGLGAHEIAATQRGGGLAVESARAGRIARGQGALQRQFQPTQAQAGMAETGGCDVERGNGSGIARLEEPTDIAPGARVLEDGGAIGGPKVRFPRHQHIVEIQVDEHPDHRHGDILIQLAQEMQSADVLQRIVVLLNFDPGKASQHRRHQRLATPGMPARKDDTLHQVT